MAGVQDVAAYILRRQGAMSAMKLQKLVYYAQAWSIARHGRVLFHQRIQAWAHGPVVRELFDLHRGQFVVSSLPGGRPEVLSADERRHIDGVLLSYAHLSADTLSSMTHRERPWVDARSGIPAGARSWAEISHESMRRYYGVRQPPVGAAELQH